MTFANGQFHSFSGILFHFAVFLFELIKISTHANVSNVCSLHSDLPIRLTDLRATFKHVLRLTPSSIWGIFWGKTLRWVSHLSTCWKESYKVSARQDETHYHLSLYFTKCFTYNLIYCSPVTAASLPKTDLEIPSQEVVSYFVVYRSYLRTICPSSGVITNLSACEKYVYKIDTHPVHPLRRDGLSKRGSHVSTRPNSFPQNPHESIREEIPLHGVPLKKILPESTVHKYSLNEVFCLFSKRSEKWIRLNFQLNCGYLCGQKCMQYSSVQCKTT